MQFEEIQLYDVITKKFECNETLQSPDPTYYEKYSFRTFQHLCEDNPVVLTLTQHDFNLIKLDSTLFNLYDRRVDCKHVFEWSIVKIIQQYLSEHKEGIFVKLCDASPKDGENLDHQRHNMKPLKNPEDIWLTLTSSRRIYTFLKHHTGEATLVTRPWNFSINENNEYRVFVRDGKLIAISQQKLYTQVKHQCKPQHLVDSVQKWLLATKYNGSGCLDMYYLEDAIHLIEVNPWHWGSGSALFKWAELLNDTSDDNIKVRFIAE